MPVYAYKGVTAAGKNTRGHLDAETPRSARARLRRDGVFVTDLEEGREAAANPAARARFAVSLPSFQRVSALDLALATRQLSTWSGAGIPLVSALRRDEPMSGARNSRERLRCAICHRGCGLADAWRRRRGSPILCGRCAPVRPAGALRRS